jgi:hypothetical protein
MKMEQSVPKRRNIKFRRRGITQQKAYNIQNTVKVWNKELFMIYYHAIFQDPTESVANCGVHCDLNTDLVHFIYTNVWLLVIAQISY